MVLPRYETFSARNVNRDSHKVLTVDGKECKFPFLHGGSIHHHCITISFSSSWCSLTHNFDRDFLWGHCAPGNTQPIVFVHSSRRFTDPCQVNPCQNGGICTLVPRRRSFECSCPESFTGRHCDQRKCYETIHLRYYDIGKSWGRIYLRNVERCTCVDGEISCERVRYTVCSENPCENDGTCRLITATREEVCACRPGYSGPYCSIAPEVECYDNKGTDYCGVVGTTVSGARFLPWRAPPSGAWGKPPTAASLRRVVPLPQLPPPPNVLPDTNQTNHTKPDKKPVCGKRNNKKISVARGRILGGNSALPGTHPWMAALYIGDDIFCAGTLVSSCWVVSAAHCFFRSPLVSKIRVILGQHKFNVTTPDTKTFGVEKYIFPERFSVFNPTLHDIVLVKLKKQDGRCVKKTQFIRPICLPNKDMTFPDQYCCQITGWGHMHEKANKYTNLQEAGVRIVPFERCILPEVYGNHVTSNMVCAGTNRCADACQGDSGGPLACVKDDVSFLYGVISWGDGCGKTGKPGVYTKVVNYVNWINTIIKRKPKSK
ncbi:hepatocyte growth factor activator-like isoform X2 [Salvelinus sp. IW2-2015]|nr:hepatocyte growth factor activator-like isoform X2 [Salvelinus alpinus]